MCAGLEVLATVCEFAVALSQIQRIISDYSDSITHPGVLFGLGANISLCKRESLSVELEISSRYKIQYNL